MRGRVLIILIAVIAALVWDRIAAGRAFASGRSAANSCGPGELCLVSTAGSDLSPEACAATHAVEATVGDLLNFCYTLTNNTGSTLEYHALRIGQDDPLLGETSLPDGGTLQYNVIKPVVATASYDASWTAWDLPSGYSPEVDPGCTGDVLFVDGFGDAPACAGSSFVDITTTGTRLVLGDDASAAVTLPFAFDFYGTTSNLICIDNNGFLLFATTDCPDAGLRTNIDLQFANLPNSAILPLWDDFDDTAGDLYYATLGETPNRVFAVEWSDRSRFDGSANPDGATFEVMLRENGEIVFAYASVSYYTAWSNRTGDATECWSGACATIGLVDSPLLLDQFSSYTFAVDDGMSIRWIPAGLHKFTASDSVDVDVGAPEIAIEPDSIVATIRAGESATIPAAIANAGNRDLVWSIDEAPSPKSHFPLQARHSRSTVESGESDIAAALPAPDVIERMRRTAAAHQTASYGRSISTAAYGCVIVAESSCDYVRFDATAPDMLTSIASENDVWFGATFIGDDFSRQYVIDGNGELSTVDTSTGAASDIGPTGIGAQMRAIAYDHATDTLFGTAIDGHETDLLVIDRSSGTVTSARPITGLGSPSYVMGIAIEPYTGLMYGIDIATSSLVAIDKTSATAAEIGSLGYTTRYSQGLSFAPASGVLYLASIAVDASSHTYSQNMYTVDVHTGHANLLGPLGNDVIQLGAFSIAEPAGSCAQASDQSWMSVGQSTGTTQPSDSTPLNVSINANNVNAGDVLSGTLCVLSNDPIRRMVPVAVSVTVTP